MNANRYIPGQWDVHMPNLPAWLLSLGTLHYRFPLGYLCVAAVCRCCLSHLSASPQVWVLNWRTEKNRGVRTVEVIRQASRQRRHFTVHLQPVNNHIDLVVDMLLPPPHVSIGALWTKFEHSGQLTLMIYFLSSLSDSAILMGTEVTDLKFTYQ